MGRPRRSDQTTAALRREIKGGRFRDVKVLPGERQLALSMQVSRTTLRRAMAELVEEGILSQRHGMGTYVTGAVDATGGAEKVPVDRPVVRYNLNGRVERVVEVSRGRFAATMDETMAFGIGPAEDVFRIVRVLVVSGRPDAVEHLSAPSRLLDDEAAIGDCLLAAVSARGHAPARRLQRLRLGTLGEDDALHLGVPPQAGAICVNEAFFTAGGGCCVFGRAVYPAARFDAVFSTSLSAEERSP